MTNRFKGFGVALATCVLVSCAEAPEHPSAPSHQPMAHIAAPADRSLAVQASAFESFMRRARGIDPGFSNPSDVAQALQVGASHEPHDLEAGMIAFAAMAALQEPRFVAAVRAEPQRGALARRLILDPKAALLLSGSEAASARASGALYVQGSALSGEGEKVKHAAYSVQHQAWAKTKVVDPAGRLSRVKRISAETHEPGRQDAELLQAALAQGARRPGPASAVVAQGVALAALSLLGSDANSRELMSEPRTASCLRMAKLNLYQCLASAGPHYEDIYCLGQHAMIDPGQCVVAATHAPTARQVAMTDASYRR